MNKNKNINTKRAFEFENTVYSNNFVKKQHSLKFVKCEGILIKLCVVFNVLTTCGHVASIVTEIKVVMSVDKSDVPHVDKTMAQVGRRRP